MTESPVASEPAVIVGTAAGIGYTAPPLSYKYKALGEFSVFLMWGPLMVLGAYFV